MDDVLRERIEGILSANPVVAFIKGSKNFPQCGFSATVVEILKRAGAEYKDINILTDSDLRQGMKDYANWPTFPQVYINGKFVGGCDILRDMYESGELAPLLKS